MLKSTIARLLIVGIMVMTGCTAAREGHRRGYQRYDQQFLIWATDHLRDDLRIARSCPGKRIRPELLSFCASLVADQSREHDAMANMLASWYQRTPHRDPYPLWIERQDGRVFEEKFLEGILRDHRELAKGAAECVRRAEHPELAQLCTEITKHREAEAHAMEEWNCRWFNKC
ncbi:MAG: DUF305 domain-containing protein [Candidatus Korobacteraceae bacterium]